MSENDAFYHNLNAKVAYLFYSSCLHAKQKSCRIQAEVIVLCSGFYSLSLSFVYWLSCSYRKDRLEVE